MNTILTEPLGQVVWTAVDVFVYCFQSGRRKPCCMPYFFLLQLVARGSGQKQKRKRKKEEEEDKADEKVATEAVLSHKRKLETYVGLS